MTVYLLNNESAIRLGGFLGVLVLVAAVEALAPRRRLIMSRKVRWSNNLALVAAGTLLVRLAFPIAATGMAALGVAHGWGLLNIVAVPFGAAMVASVLALDLAIYLQHVMFHAVPALWRLHRVHHADLDFDVTTGIRFHPLEFLLSMAVKIAVIAALGPPVAAVVLFEVLLNASSLFNHGNIRLPAVLDRGLRWFIVTPDMHRVHHSVLAAETNSNFGFNLPWWDRLLGTYRNEPQAGHQAMTIGIGLFRDPKFQRLDWLLVQPFLAGTSASGVRTAPRAGGGQ